MMMLLTFFIAISTAWGSTPLNSPPINCSCEPKQGMESCGTNPAFMHQKESDIARALGFDVPADDISAAKTAKGLALYNAFAKFLEKSDRSRMFYPEYYTRAAKDASILTLNSKFVPKNPTETDEYLRCTIPSEKYCVYRKSLRPYIGLASKVSKIDYSFLACQSYVESRFSKNARSNVGAVGYAQIRPANIQYLNDVLHRSLRNADGLKSQNRQIASVPGPRKLRIDKTQKEIAQIWKDFWRGTKHSPKNLCQNDLTCYRQVFLAQALSLKTDMLAFVTSSSGLKADFDDDGAFRIEGMDKGDSLLLLAGSYNIGVTKMMRLVSRFCSGSTKLKDCLDKIAADHEEDAQSIVTYIMRIRDCAQQYSAEQIDFDDDQRWSNNVRTEKYNQQRDRTTQCLLNPCPYSASGTRDPASK